MQLFNLRPEEISIVITCYRNVLRRKKKSSAHSVISGLRRLETLVDSACNAKRLTDRDLYSILLLLARHSWLHKYYRSQGSDVCSMIRDVYKKRPYDEDELKVLEMQYI